MSIKSFLIGFAALLPPALLFANEPTATVREAELHIQKSLNKYCIECHDADLDEGQIRLDNFSKLDSEGKSRIINLVEEQVFLQNMPPKKEKKQPTPAERSEWLKNISSWNVLQKTESTFQDKLKSAAFGNYMDHDKLFSGKYKHLQPFTYDREWIISQYIFSEKVNSLIDPKTIKTSGKSKSELRGAGLLDSISNPFLHSNKAGVRYYANKELSDSIFVTMLGNAPHIAKGIIERGRNASRNGGIAVIGRILAEDDKLNATLRSREHFLEDFTDRVCQDLYKNENDSLLPVFKPIPLKDNRVCDIKEHEPPGQFRKELPSPDGPPIYMLLKAFSNKKISHLELLRKCEKYWNDWGEPKNVITRRVETLRKYLVFALTTPPRRGNASLPVYKALDSKEMSVINATVKKVRKAGMTYRDIMNACMNVWRSEFQTLRNKIPIKKEDAAQLVKELHHSLYERQPNSDELQKCIELLYLYAKDVSKEDAIRQLIEMLLLRSEFTVRNEIGSGKADEHGRKMLSPRNASYALAYALTDSVPDNQLVQAVKEGRLNSREDYKREILRMLKDTSKSYKMGISAGSPADSLTSMPIRKHRFFREFFGYDTALAIFKDEKRLAEEIGMTRHRLILEADMLVEYILENDKNVFEELLTTDEFFVMHSGSSRKDMEQIGKHAGDFYSYFKKQNWKSFQLADLDKHKKVLGKLKTSGKNGERVLTLLKKFMEEYSTYSSGKKPPLTFFTSYQALFPEARSLFGEMSKVNQFKNIIRYYVQDPETWSPSPVQPAKVPNRMGILTHPAWLQAFSQNTHTDPVTRGKWIREKLLAGTIPDVPIGVEAVIPEDHTRTLRQRLAEVTEVKACWRCHKLMNPLGNAFEMYDDFGRYRTEEELEHPKNLLNPLDATMVKNPHKEKGRLMILRHRNKYKTAAMDSSGEISLSGDSKLHGRVNNAHEMIARLVKSDLVRQSIIRHAFRYFMGRNEMLSDSKTLIDADQAYLKSGGSFDAVIVSLLTSDSFIYRKEYKD